MAPQKILFISEGQLGDLLLLTPAIRAVKKSFPPALVTLLIIQRRNNNFNIDSIDSLNDVIVDSSCNPLINNPFIENIFIINHNAIRSLRGFKKIKLELQLIKFLRQKKYDAAISTFPHDRFIIWAFASGAKIRCGEANQTFSFLLTHKIKKTKEDLGVLKYYLELVKRIGAKEDSTKTDYYVTDDSLKWANNFLSENKLKDEQNKFIAIHPGASGNYKIWSPENFAALIQKLNNEKNIKVILCFGENDSLITNQIKNYLTDDEAANILFTTTENDLNKMAALFKNCNLTITNDSGPRHLSAAVGTPNITLFRKHHDKAWKVYPENNFTSTIQSKIECPHCSAGECNDKIPDDKIFGSYCMREITVAEVHKKIKKVIAC